MMISWFKMDAVICCYLYIDAIIFFILLRGISDHLHYIKSDGLNKKD